NFRLRRPRIRKTRMVTSPAVRASQMEGSVADSPDNHWVMDCIGGADPKNRFDPYNRYGVAQFWNTPGGRANARGSFIRVRRESAGAAGGLYRPRPPPSAVTPSRNRPR